MPRTDESADRPTAALNDAARLAALARTGLLGSEAEPSFDRLARLAARLLGVPVALVSLVDADRQFFKSCVGLPEPWASDRQTPLSHSFCQHVVAAGEPLAIEDARLDPRVEGNLAIPEIGVVAYLGIPIVVDGHVIGSFCAIDGRPKAWTDDDLATMGDLAQSVISEIALRAESAERDRSRREAEAARKNLEVTLASIGDAVIATDAAGLVTFINPAASQLTGWPAEEARGRSVSAVFHIVEERTGRAIDHFVDGVLATGKPAPWGSHTILIAREGDCREIEESAAPILIDGKVAGAVAIFRDVGPRKREAKSLEDARLRLQYVLDAGAVATWTWDVPSDTLVPDATMARLFSIPPELAAGCPVEHLVRAIHPDDREATMAVVARSLATGESYEAEYRLLQPDGGIRWVIAKSSPTLSPGGSPRSLSGVVIDITDRKRAEDELRSSEGRYRTLFTSMDQGYCVIQILRDAAGRSIDYLFLEVNPAFVVQTGLRDAAGKRMREIIPDHDEFWFETYGRVAATGEPIRFQHASESMQGEAFDLYAFPIGDPAEEKVAVLFTNITHRIRNEAERERLVEQLRDADRRKDEFLAMLAHELRNPVGAISSGMELVQAVEKPELLAELRGMIQHQVKHLTHLIDDLLDVSRITQGKIGLRKRSVELAAITRKAAELARPQVDEKRHELTISTPADPLAFVADPTRVEQMLSNLLTNAAKYSEPGRSIDLSARAEGDQVVFRVRDQGFGISAEMLPKVFGLFTQVDATLDRSRGGLGIGLTLVKNLAELHGGSASAASEGEGKGSEFTLRLPIGRPETPALAADPTPMRPAATRAKRPEHRILIIDDNRDTARLTSRLLAHRGYAMMTAHDGFEGVEAAKAFEPHAILLDIGLPGMNGYEVAAAIRNHQCCQEAIFVAVSGYGEAAARERSKAAGIDHHLTKPLDFDQLDAILQLIRDSPRCGA